MMNNILHYAEDGVWQCWNCSNCISKKEFTMHIVDNDSTKTYIKTWLPECRVADQYMLYTTQVPCDKFSFDGEAHWIIKEGVLHPLETDGICSHCGYTTGFYSLYKFCPNCGFHMKEVETSEQ